MLSNVYFSVRYVDFGGVRLSDDSASLGCDSVTAVTVGSCRVVDPA